eukprot:TRINITY_DN1624_c0_g1_i2.p1 TRINITY_DN1624_c0_g1~~TRINITY_DN1624_c0_g1_i2.p1  ORF type:complete len:100 (+),score=15.19 TRINITY_DN1624_c0_g1_i2:353-652(+)
MKKIDKEDIAPITRMSVVQVKEDKMDDLIGYYNETLSPTYSNCKGFYNAQLLVDRSQNKAYSLTSWQNELVLDENKSVQHSIPTSNKRTPPVHYWHASS